MRRLRGVLSALLIGFGLTCVGSSEARPSVPEVTRVESLESFDPGGVAATACSEDLHLDPFVSGMGIPA